MMQEETAIHLCTDFSELHVQLSYVAGFSKLTDGFILGVKSFSSAVLNARIVRLARALLFSYCVKLAIGT